MDYVENLRSVFGKWTGSANQVVDMFTFDYIAKAGHDSPANSDILKTEVAIREGWDSFEIDPENAEAVRKYLKARAQKYGDAGYTIETHITGYNHPIHGIILQSESKGVKNR